MSCVDGSWVFGAKKPFRLCCPLVVFVDRLAALVDDFERLEAVAVTAGAGRFLAGLAASELSWVGADSCEKDCCADDSSEVCTSSVVVS